MLVHRLKTAALRLRELVDGRFDRRIVVRIFIVLAPYLIRYSYLLRGKADPHSQESSTVGQSLSRCQPRLEQTKTCLQSLFSVKIQADTLRAGPLNLSLPMGLAILARQSRVQAALPSEFWRRQSPGNSLHLDVNTAWPGL